MSELARRLSPEARRVVARIRREAAPSVSLAVARERAAAVGCVIHEGPRPGVFIGAQGDRRLYGSLPELLERLGLPCDEGSTGKG